MFTLIEICYERYGEQPVYNFDTLEKLLDKFNYYNLDYRFGTKKIEYSSSTNMFQIIMDDDYLQLIIFGLSEKDQEHIKTFIKSLIN